MYKKIILILLFFFLIGLFMSINIVEAATVTEVVHLEEIVDDQSGQLYTTVENLLIDETDKDYISQVDFSKFTNLKYLDLDTIYLGDGSVIDLAHEIERLTITNSVVNISTFDLNDFKSISIFYSYNIGDKVENEKIKYNTFLNSEYNIDPNYDKQISDIAKDIYNKSDKTIEGIIKDVTLYVVDNITYDDNNTYTSLPEIESIIDKKMGVCEHYALLESQLLNKLGIFSINVGGYINADDPLNSTHAWNLVYVNNEWYNIDPTWLDTEVNRENVVSNKEDPYYMSKIDSEDFKTHHILYFTNYDEIPINNRVSQMSIVESIIKENEKAQEEENVKKEPNQKTDNPATSKDNYLWIIFGILILFPILYVLKKKRLFFKI